MISKALSTPRRSALTTAVLASLGVFVLTGCNTLESAFSSTDFSLYQGEPVAFQGEGGENETIDGIDVWRHGFPNRRYRVVGTITSHGYTASARLEEAIKTAKQYNADALIVGEDYGSTPHGGVGAFGGSGMGLSLGTGVSLPFERPQTNYTAIRYLNKGEAS